MGSVRKKVLLLLLLPFAFCSGVSLADTDSYNKCILEEMKKADGSASIESIRSKCSVYLDSSAQVQEDAKKADEDSSSSLINKRLKKESETIESAFVLTPHRPNYVMPYTYNPSRNPNPFGVKRDSLDNEEIKFQISVKYLLFDRMFKDNGDLYIAYTNQSYWQAYNSAASSPFRETNHEPETWLQFKTNYDIAGIKLGLVSVGLNHQSNGRGMASFNGSEMVDVSRSWNRVFMNFIFEKGNWVLSLKPWYRIPEDEKDDNNPSIEKYVGYGELKTAYKWNDQIFSMVLRNNLRDSENKGAVEIGWSFPLYKKLRGYVQHYNGYCESLVDYDASSNRFGAGIMLSDAL